MYKVNFNTNAPITKGMIADNFQVSVIPHVDIVTPGNESQITQQDRVIKRQTEATVLSTANITYSGEESVEGVIMTSLNPSIAIVSDSGEVTRVSDGTCNVKVASKKGEAWARRSVKVNVNLTAGGVVDSIIQNTGTNGSLRKAISEKIYSDINNKTPGSISQDLYTNVVYDLNTPSATLNPALLGSYDFSHVSLFSYTDTHGLNIAHPCYLISARHALVSRHIVGKLLGKVIFRRTNNTFQTVNTLGWSDLGYDLAMIYFDANVTGCNFVKLAVSDISTKIPNLVQQVLGLQNNLSIPCYSLRYNRGLNQTESVEQQLPPADVIIDTNSRHLRLQTLQAVVTYDYRATFSLSLESADILTEPWHAAAYGGDSSSGLYFPINNSMVLIGLQQGAQTGPWIPSYSSFISTTMNNLATASGEISPNYSPEFVDLSSYTTF